MANELETSIRSVAQKIVSALEDAGEMKVETYYIEVKAGQNENAEVEHLAASTKIEWDGDSKTTLPMQQNATGGFEVDTAILDQHQRSVAVATEYRTRLLNSLLNSLQPRGKQA